LNAQGKQHQGKPTESTPLAKDEDAKQTKPTMHDKGAKQRSKPVDVRQPVQQ